MSQFPKKSNQKRGIYKHNHNKNKNNHNNNTYK
jgi:hypothetical protein